MIGENGTQTSSKTTWKNGKTEQIDVENLQRLLNDKNFMKGIKKALDILGE